MFFCLGRSIEVEETAGAAASVSSVIAKSIIANELLNREKPCVPRPKELVWLIVSLWWWG